MLVSKIYIAVVFLFLCENTPVMPEIVTSVLSTMIVKSPLTRRGSMFKLFFKLSYPGEEI